MAHKLKLKPRGEKPQKALSFSETVEVLTGEPGKLPAAAFYSLSNMRSEDIRRLAAVWGGVPVETRRTLMRRIAEVTETDFELDFREVTRLAMTDLDDEVREAAIESVWVDESAEMCHRLMTMASADLSPRVRAAAASALGPFILQGELDSFDSQVARQAQNVAIKLYNNTTEDVDVRRRALEAISNCSRQGVSDMIEEAYASHNRLMKISAIYGMGRSYDERWAETVLQELHNEDEEIQFEAARAAGELELKEAVPVLAELISQDDREILEVSVWSLGEIGGSEATHMLEDLLEQAEERNDDALIEAIHEALETASLTLDNFDLLEE